LNPACDKSFLNSHFIEEFYSSMKNEIMVRYGPRITSDRVLSAIVFGDSLKLKEEDTLSAIQQSIISNPLVAFNADDGVIQVVESSLMMLWCAAKQEGQTDLAKQIERLV
jgi:hypothetical protein